MICFFWLLYHQNMKTFAYTQSYLHLSLFFFHGLFFFLSFFYLLFLVDKHNSPVLGAALLNLGRWSDATRELSKCLKEPTHGMNAAMDTVRHLARARGALNQHKRAAREILKYCQHRFSPKRSGYQAVKPSDRRRDQYVRKF